MVVTQTRQRDQYQTHTILAAALSVTPLTLSNPEILIQDLFPPQTPTP